MSTTREKLKKMLTDRGMFDSDADKVLENVIPQIESMGPMYKITWNSPADGYPDTFYNLIWLLLRKTALKWIDENVPEAWFRPMFFNN